MGFNRFKWNIVFRVILLTISILITTYSFLFLEYNMVGIFFILLSVIQIYSLILYVDKTNRDLTRFFNSIKFSDFSETFSAKNYGSSFSELHNSFKNVMEQFRNTRSEMEEHFQYLQTVVKHIKTGLISFSSDGDISLINRTAKELLKVGEIKNINQLRSFSNPLVDLLMSITPGEKHLLKIETENHPLQLSIFAAEFRMRNKKFILVSLQDIYSELEVLTE